MRDSSAIPRRSLMAAALLSPAMAGTQLASAATAGNDLRAVLQQAGLLLPGRYEKRDLDLSGPIALAAAVPGTVEVVIPPGEYLYDRPGFVDQVHLDGIRFQGGAGVLRLSSTGQNVARGVRITRCDFAGYTQCAIGNNSSDHPYLLVQDCRFHCAKGASAIGIAWGGYADCSVIERNAFLLNAYHLKIGPRLSGNIAIHKNDFILLDSHDRQADIWIVPNDDPGGWGQNSGFGSSIAYNKFGNENLRGQGRRILLAAEDGASGADRLSRRHRDAMARTGFVSGLTIAHNRISGADRLTGPFLQSYAPKFRYFTWYGNSLDGTPYRCLVEQAGGERLTRAELAWNIRLDAADGPAQPPIFTNVRAFAPASA